MCNQQKDTFVYSAAAAAAAGWVGFARLESYREIKSVLVFMMVRSEFLRHVAIWKIPQPNRAIRHTIGNTTFQILIWNGMKTLPDHLNLFSGIWSRWRNTACEQPLGKKKANKKIKNKLPQWAFMRDKKGRLNQPSAWEASRRSQRGEGPGRAGLPEKQHCRSAH